MKNIFYIAFAMMSLLCMSCSNNDEDVVGKWQSMNVTSTNVKTEALEGDYEGSYVVNVPKEGSSFNLKVENYSQWWVSSIGIRSSEGDISLKAADYETVYSLFSANQGKKKENLEQYDGWYKMQVSDNNVAISVPENQGTQKRTILLVMTAGDVFSHIYIEQAASE